MCNVVISTIKSTIKTIPLASVQDFFCGKVINVGTKDCGLDLDIEKGGVYGFAIKIDCKDKYTVFSSIKEYKNFKKIEVTNWKPIEDDYYPLYWGTDMNLGTRITAHIKNFAGTGAIHLCDSRYNSIKKYEIIYGAVLCSERKSVENALLKKYPCILKTFK